MCLELRMFARVRIAKKDIEVFKVMKKTVEPYIFLSPYMRAQCSLGPTPIVDVQKEKDYRGDRVVKSGWHSFGSEVEAKREAEDWEFGAAHRYGTHMVLRCLIPKGARYYKGTWNGQVSYASSQIVFVEVIK